MVRVACEIVLHAAPPVASRTNTRTQRATRKDGKEEKEEKKNEGKMMVKHGDQLLSIEKLLHSAIPRIDRFRLALQSCISDPIFDTPTRKH